MKVKKEFTGRDNNEWLTSDKFTFVLEPENDAAKAGIADGSIEMKTSKVTISNATEALGKAFGDIVFTKAGEYTFKLYEEAKHPETGEAIENVKYDTVVRIVTVTATDNGDGTMNLAVNISGGTLTFKNVYEKPAVTPTNPTPLTPGAPKTGDYSQTSIWSIVAIVSLTACVIIHMSEKKKKENE